MGRIVFCDGGHRDPVTNLTIEIMTGLELLFSPRSQIGTDVARKVGMACL